MADGTKRLKNMLEALRSRGYRITPQRLAILKILAESRGHPSVESIYKEVKAAFPTTSLATIYKTLTLLKELGQVLELGFADWGSRYDGNRPFPHPHIICTQCGAIVDPENESMSVMTQEMAQASGFKITHHRLDFFGLCPQCQKVE